MIIFKIFTRCGARTMLFRPGPHPMIMAKPKTGFFTLTETVELTQLLPDGSRFTGQFDLGAYVDVGDRQALSVSEVSFIYQKGADNDSNPEGMLAANGSIGVQLTDQNPGAVFIRANNSSLVASGHLSIDVANNITSKDSDIFPDNFGPAPEHKNIIQDTLFIVAGNDGANIGGSSVYVTVLIRARIVTLTTKDYYAIAVQSSASD